MAYTDLSGSKLRSKLGAMLNESASAPTSKFAQRHMAKMGWTEGTGLGKNRSGIVSHVKVRKREDEMGLGVEKAAAVEAGNTWWQDSVGATLARLSKGKDAKSKKKKERSKQRSQNNKKVTTGEGAAKVYTDEELFMATGGARFGMRAQRRAEAKWARTESGSELWEEEVKARKRVEWNGLGSAKVLLGDADALQKRKNDSNYTVVVEEQTLTETKIKKRKKNVAGEIGAPSVSANREKCSDSHVSSRRSGASSEIIEMSPSSSGTSSDDDAGRKERKRRKKAKRAKKQQLKAAVEETDKESSSRSFNVERQRKKKRKRNDKKE